MSLSKKAAKAKEPAVKKSIINWLNEQHEAGNQLSIRWEGGGDSGWAYFEIDNDTVENEYTEVLVDKMHDTLDYGSWAGEFSANGEAIYNPETRSFEGTDYYSEDEHDTIDCNIKIVIPKKLFWSDAFHVEIESNYDDRPDISTRFVVKNGFVTQEHEDFCHNLEEVLRDDFEAVFDNYTGDEFRGCNDSWVINKNEFTEEEDNLVYTIERVEIQTRESSEKNIVLELDEEFVEDIDNQLNKK